MSQTKIITFKAEELEDMIEIAIDALVHAIQEHNPPMEIVKETEGKWDCGCLYSIQFKGQQFCLKCDGPTLVYNYIAATAVDTEPKSTVAH